MVNSQHMRICLPYSGLKALLTVFWKKLTPELKQNGSVIQDAMQLLLPMAKRAHGMELQDIEQVLDWDKLDDIERARGRNAQQGFAGSSIFKPNDSTDKVFIPQSYNKDSRKYEKQSQHVAKGVIYQHYCNYCYLALGKKFKHSKTKCHRLRNDNKNTSTSQ